MSDLSVNNVGSPPPATKPSEQGSWLGSWFSSAPSETPPSTPIKKGQASHIVLGVEEEPQPVELEDVGTSTGELHARLMEGTQWMNDHFGFDDVGTVDDDSSWGEKAEMFANAYVDRLQHEFSDSKALHHIARCIQQLVLELAELLKETFPFLEDILPAAAEDELDEAGVVLPPKPDPVDDEATRLLRERVKVDPMVIKLNEAWKRWLFGERQALSSGDEKVLTTVRDLTVDILTTLRSSQEINEIFEEVEVQDFGSNLSIELGDSLRDRITASSVADARQALLLKLGQVMPVLLHTMDKIKPKQDETPEATLRRAIKAMASAKASGDGRARNYLHPATNYNRWGDWKVQRDNEMLYLRTLCKELLLVLHADLSSREGELPPGLDLIRPFAGVIGKHIASAVCDLLDQYARLIHVVPALNAAKEPKNLSDYVYMGWGAWTTPKSMQKFLTEPEIDAMTHVLEAGTVLGLSKFVVNRVDVADATQEVLSRFMHHDEAGNATVVLEKLGFLMLNLEKENPPAEVVSSGGKTVSKFVNYVSGLGEGAKKVSTWATPIKPTGFGMYDMLLRGVGLDLVEQVLRAFFPQLPSRRELVQKSFGQKYPSGPVINLENASG